MNKPINPTHENANFIYLNDLSQRRMARDLITKMIKQTETFAKDKTNKRNKTELTDQISALKHRALSYWLKNPIFFPRMTLFTFTFLDSISVKRSLSKGHVSFTQSPEFFELWIKYERDPLTGV